MNKNFSKISILLATSLWGGHLMAGSVTIPNTFVGGATASASEVNANFDAVKTAVDENDNRITTNISDINTNSANITANTNSISAAVPPVQLKDANGAYIGRVIGMEKIYLPSVLTDQGYRTRISLGLGSVIHEVSVFYESVDCTGAAYVDGARYIGSLFTPGTYDLSYSAGLLLYTPNDAQSSKINVQATRDSSLNCIASGVETIEGYPAELNDPVMTGIENTAYPVRMVME